MNTLIVLTSSLISGLIGFLLKTYLSKKIESTYNTKIQNLKHEHSKELESIKHKQTTELESLKIEYSKMMLQKQFEFDVIKNRFDIKNEAEKEKLKKIVEIRATNYPLLIALLRKIKIKFYDLYLYTNPKSDYGKPVNLKSKSSETKKVISEFEEIVKICKDFDLLLSKFRLFVTRSEYPTIIYAKGFAESVIRHKVDPEYTEKSFFIKEGQLDKVYDKYNNDITFLSDELYGLKLTSFYDEHIKEELNSRKSEALKHILYDRILKGDLKIEDKRIDIDDFERYKTSKNNGT